LVRQHFGSNVGFLTKKPGKTLVFDWKKEGKHNNFNKVLAYILDIEISTYFNKSL
jgi:hypothetical protein